MPGFRPGKAPRRLLEARLGTEMARDQALRDSLPEYYAEAVVAEDVDVIAPPEIDITAGEEEGDVEFDAVVEVRPVFTVEGHDQLRIEIEKPDVSDDDVATPDRPAARSLRRPRRQRRAAHRRRLRRDRHQGLRRRRVGRRPHRHRLPLRGRVGDRGAEARRGAARQAARRHPQVRRHAARALRRARRRRGLLPGPRQGNEEEGAPRAHRRVGERGQRVRDRRRAAGRRPHAPRHVRPRAGLDGDAREGLRSGRRARARGGARDARQQRDGAAPARPRAPARGAGSAHDDPAVPRRPPARTSRSSSTACAPVPPKPCAPTSRCVR